jgi:hypothetical protein
MLVIKLHKVFPHNALLVIIAQEELQNKIQEMDLQVTFVLQATIVNKVARSQPLVPLVPTKHKKVDLKLRNV